jgi:hypothetical protein
MKQLITLKQMDNISRDMVRASVWQSTKEATWQATGYSIWVSIGYEIWNSGVDTVCLAVRRSVRNSVRDSAQDYFKQK